MKHNGVIVFWIDQSFIVRNATISPSDSKKRGSYKSEALKITGAIDDENMIIIDANRADDESEKNRIEGLKSKAAQMSEQKNNAGK